MKIVRIGAIAFCYLILFVLGEDSCQKLGKKECSENTNECQYIGDVIKPEKKCAPVVNNPTKEEKEEECMKWTKKPCDDETLVLEKEQDGDRKSQAVQWKGSGFCIISEPGDVTNFRVVCNGATYLDFSIADCCVWGDHWQLKGKQWDRAPNTAVTTSPGQANLFGKVGRIYNYGGTLYSPKKNGCVGRMLIPTRHCFICCGILCPV